jgi:Kef-type K+ transport system membrane component KefB
LSVIAFLIGGSLSLIKLKRLGKHIFWITFTQAFGAFISTTLMLSLFFYFIHSLGAIQSSFWTLYFPMAFVIGAISAATAPAAIMAIVHEYRAKGPFTTILLGVIALDDALTILCKPGSGFFNELSIFSCLFYMPFFVYWRSIGDVPEKVDWFCNAKRGDAWSDSRNHLFCRRSGNKP